jgi:hypothetical protein
MATNRLAQILEQEYKTKGIVGGAVSALNKRSREKMDIRNALFSGGGLGSTIATKIFGKGYSATRRTPSVTSSTSPSLDGSSNALLEKINKNSKIAAKNSVVFPAMARDMNLMRMNMQKMVRLSGGTPSMKSDMFFKRAGDREKQYNQQYGRASSSSSSSGGGGGLLSGLGSIGGSLLGGLGSIGGGLLSIGGSILSGIGSLIGGVAGGIFSIISGALGGLGPLGIILGAAAGFMIYSIAKSIDFEKMGVDFKKMYTDVSTSIKSFFGIEGDGKGGLLTTFAKALDDTFKTTMFSSTLDKMSNIMQSAFDKITDVTIGAFNFMSGALVALANDMKGHFLQFLDEYGGYIIAAAAGGGALALGGGRGVGKAAKGGAKALLGMSRFLIANPPLAAAALALGVTAYGLSELAPTEQERLTKHLPEERTKVQAALEVAKKNPAMLGDMISKHEKRLIELDEEQKALLLKAKEAEKKREERRTDHFSRYMEANNVSQEINKAGDKRESDNSPNKVGGMNSSRLFNKQKREEKENSASSNSPVFQGQTAALLALIGAAEGGAMGYDASNMGRANDTPGGYPGLSGLTVNEVMKLQKDGKIKAAGMYQIIPGTLAGLMKGNYGATGVKGTDIFNATTQDKLGSTLIDARIRAGGGDPIETQYQLSQEFAVIEDPYTGKSHHAGKGNNRAFITSAQVQALFKPGNTRPNVLAQTNKAEEAKAAAEKAKEDVAASKPLFSQEDLTALANALKSQSMTGGGMTTAALVSKATPYERDFYMGVVRTNAL